MANNYLSDEQIKELDRRAALKALDEFEPNPAGIIRAIQSKEKAKEATMESLKPPSVQRIREITVKREEQKIHTLHVFPNQVTTLTLSDSMGVAWPLHADPIVGSGAYTVNYKADNPGLITIQTSDKFVPSNMVLAIKGRLRPLQFQLVSNNEVLDSIVDIKINGKSPNNDIPVKQPFGGLNIPEPDGHRIAQFLGQPPEDAMALTLVGDPNVKAWKWQEKVVIKAPYTLLNPSNPISVQKSLDSDYKVFLLNSSSFVMTFLNDVTSQIINVEVIGG